MVAQAPPILPEAQPLLPGLVDEHPPLFHGRRVVILNGFPSYYEKVYVPEQIRRNPSFSRVGKKVRLVLHVFTTVIRMNRDFALSIALFGLCGIVCPVVIPAVIISLRFRSILVNSMRRIRLWTLLNLSSGFIPNFSESFNFNVFTINSNDPILSDVSMEKKQQLLLYQEFNEILLDPALPRRRTLDPAINPDHLFVELVTNEIPEAPKETQIHELNDFVDEWIALADKWRNLLDELIAFGQIDDDQIREWSALVDQVIVFVDRLSELSQDPAIVLSKFIENVNGGCQGLLGVPARREEAAQFKMRLERLTAHILWQLKNGNHSEELKTSVVEGLMEASSMCAPRHMEEAEQHYQNMTDSVRTLDTRQKAIQITQKLRTEIVTNLTQKVRGNTHAKRGLLDVLGPTFNIPGHNAQQDSFAFWFKPADTQDVFRGLYTADAIVNRFACAVNVPSANREISREELIDWFLDHIPENYIPRKTDLLAAKKNLCLEEEGDQLSEEDEENVRKMAYLMEKVLMGDGIQPEALRYALVTMGILQNPESLGETNL